MIEKNYSIYIVNDPDYSSNSVDNNRSYLKYHNTDNTSVYQPSSKHGIRIEDEGIEVSSCLVSGFGGATGIHEGSTISDKHQLALCCGDSICSLSIPELEMLWCTKADWATCFQIFKIENDYVVHGEIDITRLDNKGNIKWQFSGADIFVNIEGKEAFILFPAHIQLTDFGNKIYKIDYDGNLIV